jgi:hypothetical protein
MAKYIFLVNAEHANRNFGDLEQYKLDFIHLHTRTLRSFTVFYAVKEPRKGKVYKKIK